MACSSTAPLRHASSSPGAKAAAPERRRAAVADSATLENQCHPRKIFIGGLAHKTTTQQLRDYFSRYGAIVDAVVLRWPDGRSRGFGYVTFSETAAASAALRLSHQVGGRQIDVKRAVPGTNKLFVGGLPQNTAAMELREHFEAFGIVSDAVVMIDPLTSRSRGFGFVCFLPGQEGAAAVAAALEQYDHHRLRGKWIEVKSAASPHKLAAKEGSRSPQEALTPVEGTPPVAGGSKDRKQPRPETPCAQTVQSRHQVSPAGPMSDERPVASPHRHRGRHEATDEPRKVALPTTTATMSAAMTAMGTPPGLAPVFNNSDLSSGALCAASLAPWPPSTMTGNSPLSLARALGMPGSSVPPEEQPRRGEAANGDQGNWHRARNGAGGGVFSTSNSLVESLEQLLKQQALAAAEKVGTYTDVGAREGQAGVPVCQL